MICSIVRVTPAVSTCIYQVLVPLRYKHTEITKYHRNRLPLQTIIHDTVNEYQYDNRVQTIDEISQSIQLLITSINKQQKSSLPTTTNKHTLNTTRHAQFETIIQQCRHTLLKQYNTANHMQSTELINKIHQIYDVYEKQRLLRITDYTNLIALYTTQPNAVTLADNLLTNLYNNNSSAELDTVLYNSLINLYVKHNNMAKALQLYTQMQSPSKHHATTDIYTHVTMIDGLCRAGDIKFALQLFEHARTFKNQLSVNTRLYSVMCRGLAQNGDVSGAFQLLRSLALNNPYRPNVRVTVSLFNSLLSGLNEYHDIDKLLKSMYYYNVEPTAHTIQTLLNRYGHIDLLQCINLVERIVRGKYKLLEMDTKIIYDDSIIDLGHIKLITQLVQSNQHISILMKYIILYRFYSTVQQRHNICDLRLLRHNHDTMKLYINYYMFIQTMKYISSSKSSHNIMYLFGHDNSVDNHAEPVDDVIVDDNTGLPIQPTIKPNHKQNLCSHVQTLLQQLSPPLQHSTDITNTTGITFLSVPPQPLRYYLSLHADVLKQHIPELNIDYINNKISQLKSGEILYDTVNQKLLQYKHIVKHHKHNDTIKQSFRHKMEYNIEQLYQLRSLVSANEKPKKSMDIDTVLQRLNIDQYNTQYA